MRLSALLLAFLIPGIAIADDPLEKGDPELGKALHDQSCIACHVRMYGGDGSRMYTREGRLVSNRQELLQRVAACSAMAKAGWVPEEEAAVAAWLNHQFYKFEK